MKPVIIEMFLEYKSGNSWLKLKVCQKIRSHAEGIEVLQRKSLIYPTETFRFMLLDDSGARWEYIPERHAFKPHKGG